MPKVNSKLIETPATELCGDPTDREVKQGIADGEPGLPGRTPSPNAVPERIRDTSGGLPAKKGG